MRFLRLFAANQVWVIGRIGREKAQKAQKKAG